MLFGGIALLNILHTFISCQLLLILNQDAELNTSPHVKFAEKCLRTYLRCSFDSSSCVSCISRCATASLNWSLVLKVASRCAPTRPDGTDLGQQNHKILLSMIPDRVLGQVAAVSDTDWPHAAVQGYCFNNIILVLVTQEMQAGMPKVVVLEGCWTRTWADGRRGTAERQP